MHIQHPKLNDKKIWQFADQISNAHVQYKLVLEEYMVMQISSHIILLSQYLGFP